MPQTSPPLREVPTEWEAEGVGARGKTAFRCINFPSGFDSELCEALEAFGEEETFPTQILLVN